MSGLKPEDSLTIPRARRHFKQHYLKGRVCVRRYCSADLCTLPGLRSGLEAKHYTRQRLQKRCANQSWVFKI